MDVLSKINSLRIEKGLSVNKLASLAGITQSTLQSLIEKNGIPSIPTLEKLCYALEISMSDFFKESDSENNVTNPDSVEPSKMTFNVGARIKKLRKNLNISSSTLADSINVNQSFISAIENNTKKCSLENLEKICDSLNVSLSDFFNTSDKSFSPELQKLLANVSNMSSYQLTKLNEFIETIR